MLIAFFNVSLMYLTYHFFVCVYVTQYNFFLFANLSFLTDFVYEGEEYVLLSMVPGRQQTLN